MRFDVPTAEARGLVEEARPLLDGPVATAIEEHRRSSGREPSLEPDGSLAEHVRRLRAHGLAVEVLGRGEEKVVSSTEVRRLIRAGLAWEHLVSAAVPIIRDAINSEPRRFGKPA